MKKMLQAFQHLGFDTKRFQLEWISASEGAKFSKVVAEFTDQIKGLGPNPMRSVGDT
jgi:F420-non-reducing hydrogenase iron-sulfur subunit